MSGSSPPDKQRIPLQERSVSRTNTLAAIRIVPYSPPRPLSLASKEQSTSLHSPGQHTSGDGNQTDGCRGQLDFSDKLGACPSHHAPGSVSPSSTAASRRSSIPLAAARGRGVSGSQVRSDGESRRSSLQTVLGPDGVTTASPSPSDAQVISQVHASSHYTDPTTTFGASPGRPRSRRRNFITVNSGRGTFSLQPQAGLQNQGIAFKSPSLSLSLSTQSSFERLSDLFSSDGRPSTPLSTLPERTPSPCTREADLTRLAGEQLAGSNASPWNYRLVGGLRKVPTTPVTKPYTSSPSPAVTASPSGVWQPCQSSSALVDEPEDSHSLLNKTSFQSAQSVSTTSENTNYKVYGATSSAPTSSPLPNSAQPPSSSDSSNSANTNYQVLARSSPAPFRSSIDLSPPKTADSDSNFVVHGEQSPLASSVGTRAALHSQYSQESLIVPPLKPVKQKLSFERFGPYKSRSKESFRTGSLTSINSIIGQEALHAFLATPLGLQKPSGPASFAGLDPNLWTGSSTDHALQKAPMQAHPHQWSSQLSTVHSESECGSEPASRSVSPLSAGGWRSSGYLSNHSRHILSISSSLAAHENSSNSRSLSLADSLDRPQPTLSRGATVRLVRDQDEHGDGLGELRDIHNPLLHQRPSRRRLASLLSSSSSDRNLHSSGSSRSNSLNSSSIPTWARLYYGSGERRWLRHAASSESMITDCNDASRPNSSFRNGSPSSDHLPLTIYSPRRRPREVRPPASGRPASDAGSLDVGPAPLQGVLLRSTVRKQTSSIWSPHLARDQRASGYSIWEPPSVNWSTESGPLGRRNIQVVLFMAGFILPLAWMAGSFLPLPPKPETEMLEQPSDSLLDMPRHNPQRRNHLDDRQYYSARWWRNLNRLMAVAGLLVIAAIVALVVVSLREGWGT